MLQAKVLAVLLPGECCRLQLLVPKMPASGAPLRCAGQQVKDTKLRSISAIAMPPANIAGATSMERVRMSSAGSHRGQTCSLQPADAKHHCDSSGSDAPDLQSIAFIR
jgi:hypothetical protein